MSSTTRTDLGLLILRIAIGLTAMYYGSQKLLGIFGGPGVAATVLVRGETGWDARALTACDVLAMPEIDVSLVLSDTYGDAVPLAAEPG